MQRKLAHLTLRRLDVPDPTEDGGKLRPLKAVLLRPRPPTGPRDFEIEVDLDLAGADRSDLRGAPPAATCRLKVLLDLSTASGELSKHRFGDAGDLRHPLARFAPRHAKVRGQLGAKVRLVEVAGSETMGAQDQVAVQGAPLACVSLGKVRDDDVSV